jgi:hypothetical protein
MRFSRRAITDMVCNSESEGIPRPELFSGRWRRDERDCSCISKDVRIIFLTNSSKQEKQVFGIERDRRSCMTLEVMHIRAMSKND